MGCENRNNQLKLEIKTLTVNLNGIKKTLTVNLNGI